MNKTTNYQLNQWERADRVLMDDFNADNAKIDAALAVLAEKTEDKADASALETLSGVLEAAQGAIPKIAAGSYAGNGSAYWSIDVGFAPKSLFKIF